MPRNDQVTRQWLLLQKLESSRGMTLEQLVDSLPEDYPKNPRTIRRDLEALQIVGVPLVTERSDGRTCWKLIEGFRHIPALGFSPTELMSLVFSRNLLKPLEGTEIQSSLDSALNKMAAALPQQGHAYVRDMQQIISVGRIQYKSYREHRGTIDCISRAISQARTAQIRYYSASRHTTTRRDVDSYRLWYAAGGLYLIAYCHLRRDVRMFAVERIRSIILTEHPYQLPLGFNVEEYVQDALLVMRGRRIEVDLLFSKAAAAWVKDKTWHPSQEGSVLKDGRLRMTLKIADTAELVGWILSFGSQVKVVRPDGLREKLKEEARKILRS
jgi:predicted DNA-binding transcriptional regulator YafY